MKLIALFAIFLLLFSLGCAKQQAPAGEISGDLEVPETDILMPEESLTAELEATGEPSFGTTT